MSAMGIGLIIFILLFFVLGVGMYFLVQGSGKRYIIAGKSLPFFLIGSMLLAQSLDANATMGNAAGVYSGGWWAGFQFAFGLALCLLITGMFLCQAAEPDESVDACRIFIFEDITGLWRSSSPF